MFLDGGDLSDYDYTLPEENVIEALQAITMWLSNQGAYAQTTYYKQIYALFDDEADARSFALRMLIHYVGDQH